MTVSCRFVGAVLSLLCASTPAAAGLPQAPGTAATQQPPAKPEPKPEQKPGEPPKYEETVVVSASQHRGEAHQRAGDDERDHHADDRERADANFAELLRTVPGVNITQVSARDINVTSRARHRHAGDRAARAARRPQPLPGLLRVRHVGLPAGQPERDQAD